MAPALRRFFLAFIELHILHHASQAPIFGLDMIRELRRHGYELSPGTLYPTLHLMERQGSLRCQERVVEGRRRKYYVATAAGRRLLRASRAKVLELTGEIIGTGDSPADGNWLGP
jgi:DNA-binding PadR family transcriptional regulator